MKVLEVEESLRFYLVLEALMSPSEIEKSEVVFIWLRLHLQPGQQ